ncbi:outer membrane protein transport protein [candidate division KSB1 bacterium]|nr:outer membrane protein transport protein [bacterium]NUM67174.1 outer membrane protein transport protein [candidate division KSB1 bacterium]
MRIRSVHLLLALLSIMLSSPTLFSQGFGLTAGNRALARNGLYLAGTVGSATALLNPAGLVYLPGRALELTIGDWYGQFAYERSPQDRFRSYREHNFNFSAGVYWTLAPRFSAALTFSRPADYQVNWPFALVFTKGVSTTLAAFDMFNRIQIEAISPALAWRFGRFALGVTASAYHLRQHTAFPLANQEWYQNRGEAAYQFEYEQDAWTSGVQLGLLATLSEKVRLGGTVRSAYKAALSGEATSRMLADLDGAATRVDLSGDFEMPWVWGAGLVYQLGKSWELNLDAAYSLWANTRNNFDFQFNDSRWQSRLTEVDGVTGLRGSSFPLAFANSMDLGFGFEYAPPQGLAYRAGYRYSQSPNSAESYSMLFPSVDAHSLSLGIGYQDGNFAIDAALAYTLGVTAAIAAAENSNSPGKYDVKALVPIVTVQNKF